VRRLDWTRTGLAILATVVLAGAAAAALPDNPYQRFSTLENTIQKRARWIYERIHYDPAPIDVAVVGPSRSGAAVDSPLLEADLTALGRKLDTVNFSLAENGRDLHWVIVQELLATKSPKLIVIGVIEKPGRYGHPAYKYVAPAADVIDPAFFGNVDYPANLLYLPFRQLRLLAAQAFPAVFDLPAAFDPKRYAGTNPGRPLSFVVAAGAEPDYEEPLTKAALVAQVRRYEAGVHPPVLGDRFADIEFGDERTYIARMATLARQRGIRVAFLFLPYYTGPHVIQERAFYERYGPIIDASFLSDHDDYYADAAHLNRRGAAVLTNWLAPRIAALVPERPSPAAKIAS
jgi:hypothetical protein